MQEKIDLLNEEALTLSEESDSLLTEATLLLDEILELRGLAKIYEGEVKDE